MKSTNTQLSVFSDSKRHYEILDGLRGVAAVMVVIFHILETFSGGDHLKQIINHGYLAVDFFYVLSGFVIGYAYDDRWGKMSLGEFFKRRLIRLHPMIIFGMMVGAAAFYFQACELWPGISEVPVWKMLLVMLIGFTLIPLPLSMDIRGWQEMYPLNGPAWSLFYEYIANILYALFIRKLSNQMLSLLVFIAAGVLIHFAVTNAHGDLIGGWSLEPTQLRTGISRLLYPFFAGLLLSRIAKLTYVKHAFFWCSLLLVVVFSIPRIGGAEHLWMNGLYDSLCVIIAFPFIVYVGASGELKGRLSSKLCKFLGNISYPLYIVHYPLIYLYMAWVVNHKTMLEQASPQAIIKITFVSLVVFIASILVAFAGLKLFDVPLRKWLTKRLMELKGR